MHWLSGNSSPCSRDLPQLHGKAAQLAIAGAADKNLAGGRTINLFGTSIWSGAVGPNTNDFYTGPATLNNFGTFIDANEFDTIMRDWYSGDRMVFNSSGT